MSAAVSVGASMPFAVAPPPRWLVKLRDKVAPSRRLTLRTSEGRLAYDSADLVATMLARGIFEPREIEAVARVLPACRGFVDVGANLGLYTLIAARRMTPPARVVAFEASPIEYGKLSWMVARNDLSNVTAVLSAVSDAVGETTIFESLYGAGALNRLDRPGKTTGQWRESRVPMTTLDAWFAQAGEAPVDLVKIDVEGHEFPVLAGAAGLLARQRPMVMIEINWSRASERSDPRRIWALMLENGYQWYGIMDGSGQVGPVHEPGTAINLFAIPGEPRNPDLVRRLVSG